jgi:hypothetical protein
LELFGEVEKKEDECDSEGISFVDDVAWVVEEGGCGGMHMTIGEMRRKSTEVGDGKCLSV